MKRLLMMMTVLILLTTQAFSASMRKRPYLIYPFDNSRMTVLWQATSTPSVSKIEWGTSTSYGKSMNPSMYGDKQFKAVLTGLNPSTKYYYRVTVDSEVRYGSFRSAPGNNEKNLVFYAYGDSRSHPSVHNKVTGAMLSDMENDMSRRQTLVLHSADWTGHDYESDWDDEHFNRSYSNNMKLYSQVPLMGCRGNHEGSAARLIKYYPFKGSKCYYSFDYGPVHVAVVDQYISYGPGSSQYNWLENDLAGSQKAIKIVLYHHPAWSAGPHSNSSGAQTLHNNLFTQYKVTAVINGHNHNYSRAMVDGIAHLVLGGGGAGEYSVNSSWPNVVFCERTYNYARLEVSNGNKLKITVFRENNSLIESFTLYGSEPTNDTTPPPAPKLTSPGSGQTLSDSTPTLKWDKVTDESGIQKYEVRINSSTYNAGNKNSFTAPKLSDGNYSWKVRATDNAGNTGNWSSSRSFTVDTSGGGVEDFTINARINQGSDDGEESSYGSMYITSSDLEFVYDGTNQIVAMVFRDLDIPRKATINKAYIQFKCQDPHSRSTSLTIRGQDSNTASTLTTSYNNISDRPLTSASVSWYPAPWKIAGAATANERTPDISAVIQEIINRSGWAAGNNIAIIVNGTGKRTAESYEGDRYGAPLLHIEGQYQTRKADYTSPAAPELTAPLDRSRITDSAPTFSWDSVKDESGIDYYEIELDGKTYKTGTTTSFVPGSSLTNGQHYWRVRARDKAGNMGSFSAKQSVVIEEAAPPQEKTVTFQQGVNGYSATLDTMLHAYYTNYSFKDETTLTVDRSDKGKPVQTLIRFEQIFGTGKDQIPQNATIVSAYLILKTTNAGDGARLHRMLKTWNEDSTWNSLGSGIQTNNKEALKTSDLATGNVSTGTRQFDVTKAVRAWVSGKANHGWVFLPSGSNGWDFSSSESGQPPKLVVTYRK